MLDKHLESMEFVQKIEQAPVLVIGDIMLDRFVYGTVERISPESPVPVLSVKRENTMLGGAGNTLFNLVNLGCAAKIVSLIGTDQEGAQIKTMTEQNGVDPAGLIEFSERPTIVKTRFLAGHQQLLRTDYERIENISEQAEKKILQAVQSVMDGLKSIILSDYGKGMLSKTLVKNIIKLAAQKNIPVLVDPKGFDYSTYEGADIVTPNKKELSQATGGLPVETDEQIECAARALIEKAGIGALIATRSKDGISVVTKDKTTHIRSAADIEVFDVSGAGDTVIATLAASIAAGASLTQAAALANLAGSIVVSKVGTAPIRKEELISALSNANPERREGRAPVLAHQEAREESQRWRARGLKIGFTNGCFDILHSGHVNYLGDARAKCDRLIVGLNSDSSVRVLKGANRPVHDEAARATVLAALSAVDMVVLFGASQSGQDNTAIELLKTLQPDIYFKGGDYKIEEIPEAPAVKSYGGAIEIMPVYEGHSTTGSIEKMQKSKIA